MALTLALVIARRRAAVPEVVADPLLERAVA
jgi:hypothetical protein